MKDYLQNTRETGTRRHGTAELQLHYWNGHLALDSYTHAPSNVVFCKTTIYSSYYLGTVQGSDMLLQHYKNGQMHLSIQNHDDTEFLWDSGNDDGSQTTALVHLLSEDAECLLYCSSENYFNYFVKPAKDPRGKVSVYSSNPHFESNYYVLDKLLLAKYQYSYKCNPAPSEDTLCSQ